jgi:hypothetical protein
MIIFKFLKQHGFSLSSILGVESTGYFATAYDHIQNTIR